MRKLMLGICLAGAVAIVGAQQPPSPAASASQAFEVASVKANKSGESNGMLRMLPGGRVNAQNIMLNPVITFAWQITGDQLIGGPSWLMTDRYDIVAKIDGDPAPVGPGQIGPMQRALQNLLADRFKLKVHRETREMDIYALVMAKPGGGPGPKLTPTTQDCAAQAAAARRGASPPPPAPGAAVQCGIAIGPGRIRFGGLPASQIVTALSGQSGRIGVDRTGLTGNWDFELTFAIEGRGGPGRPDQPAADQNAPSFFTAIQEQLGLKLESTKGPVEVLVIDSVEKPTDD